MSDHQLPVIVATDMDASTAGVFRYLGPVGHRFNHEHRDVSYIVLLLCAALFAVAGGLFAPTWLVEGIVLDVVIRVLTALAMLGPAYFTARAIMRRIDIQRDLAWQARTIYLESQAPRPDSYRRTAATAGTDLRSS